MLVLVVPLLLQLRLPRLRMLLGLVLVLVLERGLLVQVLLRKATTWNSSSMVAALAAARALCPAPLTSTRHPRALPMTQRRSSPGAAEQGCS